MSTFDRRIRTANGDDPATGCDRRGQQVIVGIGGQRQQTGLNGPAVDGCGDFVAAGASYFDISQRGADCDRTERAAVRTRTGSVVR